MLSTTQIRTIRTTGIGFPDVTGDFLRSGEVIDGDGVETGPEFVEEIIFDEIDENLDGPEQKKAEAKKNPVRPFAEKFFGHDPNPEQQRQRGAEGDEEILVKADEKNLHDAAADVRFVATEFENSASRKNRTGHQQGKEKENREAGTRTFPGKIVRRKLFGLPGIIGDDRGDGSTGTAR